MSIRPCTSLSSMVVSRTKNKLLQMYIKRLTDGESFYWCPHQEYIRYIRCLSRSELLREPACYRTSASLYGSTPDAKQKPDRCRAFTWCPHQESNLELLLRTELFYPLNYGDDNREYTLKYLHLAHSRATLMVRYGRKNTYKVLCRPI